MSRIERKKQASEEEKRALEEQKKAIKERKAARKAEAKKNKEAKVAAEGDNSAVNKFKNKLNDIKNKIKEKWAAFKVWFKAQERWKQILIVAGTTIVTILLILVIFVFGIFSSIFGDIFKETPDDYDLSLTAVDGYYNILLLGVDTRDMKDLEGTRSDAIMVVSINEETSDVKILSVYRDTFLKLGDTPTYDKITHACIYGGPEMTMKSLNQALDLNISNYVVVNFKAVADLVDAVGGIEVNVEDYEIEQLNKYTIETAYNIGRDEYQLVEEAGTQTLDGCQAVSYSRIRKGVGDDFKRTERMRTVVTLTMEKMKDMSFKDLRKIVKMMTPQVQTNISMGNVLGLAIRLPQYNIIGTQGWPYNVTTGYIGGVSYVFPADLESNTIKMHQDFFGQDDYYPSSNVTSISNTIIGKLEAERDAGKIEGEQNQQIDTSNTVTPPTSGGGEGDADVGSGDEGTAGDGANNPGEGTGSGDGSGSGEGGAGSGEGGTGSGGEGGAGEGGAGSGEGSGGQGGSGEGQQGGAAA